MSVILLLIPLSVVIAAAFLGAFIWAARSGQYDDTYTTCMRLLTEERRFKKLYNKESQLSNDHEC